MKTILLCTRSKNILKHWGKSLESIYSNLININSEIGLVRCLEDKSDVVLLLDNNFFVNSKDYVHSILETYPSVKIFFLDDCPTFKSGKEFLALGIKGYGNSRLSSMHLLQAINVIESGNIWLYPDFIQNMIRDIAPLNQNDKIDILGTLTTKEKEVASYVAQGYSNKMIAEKTDIAEATVKVHLRSIFGKLQVADRLSLALLLK